jgi:hypothetical protein
MKRRLEIFLYQKHFLYNTEHSNVENYRAYTKHYGNAGVHIHTQPGRQIWDSSPPHSNRYIYRFLIRDGSLSLPPQFLFLLCNMPLLSWKFKVGYTVNQNVVRGIIDLFLKFQRICPLARNALKWCLLLILQPLFVKIIKVFTARSNWSNFVSFLRSFVRSFVRSLVALDVD